MSVYFPDEKFEPDIPGNEEPLWRYIDFTQLISILETQSLWFSAANKFVDKWEGGLTASQVNRISENIPTFIENDEESVRELYDALRTSTYITCWHHRESETAAMWELYNDRGKEVAIRTTVGRLRRSIDWTDDMTMGLVNYEKYLEGNDLFPITRNSPFFHKRSSFSHEQEFRIVKSEFNIPERASLNDGLKELVDNRSAPGRPISVDPGLLIDEIVVSPVVGGWLRELVEKVIDTYERRDVTINDSSISGNPF